ncbi:RNA-dependent RNA polymerase family protein [Photobacterium leiognathi]|uniref:hypothetical protein n=1 Tax=Photobacterium leiognathi TaxID=553611 RepID=UPI002980CC31|nr:hypothetical protein [Photobacterium leiognathi]
MRYMDDFIILTTSRWQLRRAVKKLNQFFEKFSFTQHPDKTFIGKIAKGLDWLGFWFNQNGCVSISPRALANHVTKLHRLYEQVRKMPAKLQALRMVSYIKRYLLYHAIQQDVSF